VFGVKGGGLTVNLSFSDHQQEYLRNATKKINLAGGARRTGK